MQNESRRPIETIFHEARSRDTGTERQAYLDGACGDDADLRSRVEALLASHEQASSFLEDPAVARPQEGPGTSIGPYKLLQEIGEGATPRDDPRAARRPVASSPRRPSEATADHPDSPTRPADRRASACSR